MMKRMLLNILATAVMTVAALLAGSTVAQAQQRMVVRKSLVVIVSPCPEHQHEHLMFENTVDEAVLLVDVSAPSPFWPTLQWLWVSCSCGRMLHELFQQKGEFLEGFRLVVL